MATVKLPANPLGDKLNRTKATQGSMATTSQYNIPYYPDGAFIQDSTIIRFGAAAAGFGLSRLLASRNVYNPEVEGKRLQDGRRGSSVPYLNRDDIPDSRWFSGVKVLDSLIMHYPEFTTESGVKYPEQAIEIQNLLMSVQQKKNIQKTRIAGKDGRVKQYLNLDDYDISVRGKIVGHNNFKWDGVEGGIDIRGGEFTPGERPDVAIQQFYNFMEAPTAFNVYCDFLKFAGIKECVIEDFKLWQEIGKLDNQAFSFKMVTDAPFELVITDF